MPSIAVRNQSIEEYISDKQSPVPSLTSHLAGTLLVRSPAHARQNHPRLTPQDDQDESKFDIGAASHDLLLLGTDKIFEVAADDWRTKAAKEQREEARSMGMYPLLTKHAERVRTMTGIAQLERKQIIVGETHNELSIYWDAPTRGGPCWFRARLDTVTKDYLLIVEYKTTDNASSAAFQRTVSNLGYGLQAAFHIEAAISISPCNPHFLWCVQETSPPYCVAWYQLPPDWLAYESQRMHQAAEIWAQCLARDRFPGYDSHPRELPLPGWLATRYTEDDVTREVRYDLGSQA